MFSSTMASQAKIDAETGREDISRFIVHLTRDDRDTFNNGQERSRIGSTILCKLRIGAN